MVVSPGALITIWGCRATGLYFLLRLAKSRHSSVFSGGERGGPLMNSAMAFRAASSGVRRAASRTTRSLSAGLSSQALPTSAKCRRAFQSRWTSALEDALCGSFSKAWPSSTPSRVVHLIRAVASRAPGHNGIYRSGKRPHLCAALTPRLAARWPASSMSTSRLTDARRL
jgi:hypothetical protein